MAHYPNYLAAGMPYPVHPYWTPSIAALNPMPHPPSFYDNDQDRMFHLREPMTRPGFGALDRPGVFNTIPNPPRDGSRPWAPKHTSPLYDFPPKEPGFDPLLSPPRNIGIGNYHDRFLIDIHRRFQVRPMVEGGLLGSHDTDHGHLSTFEPPVRSSRIASLNNRFGDLEMVRLMQRGALNNAFLDTHGHPTLHPRPTGYVPQSEIQAICDKIKDELDEEQQYRKALDFKWRRYLALTVAELDKQRAQIKEIFVQENVDVKRFPQKRQEDRTDKPSPLPDHIKDHSKEPAPGKPALPVRPRKPQVQQTQPHDKDAKIHLAKSDDSSAQQPQICQQGKPTRKTTAPAPTQLNTNSAHPSISSATVSPRDTDSNLLPSKQALSSSSTSRPTNTVAHCSKERTTHTSKSNNNSPKVPLPASVDSDDDDDVEIIPRHVTFAVDIRDIDDDDDEEWDTPSVKNIGREGGVLETHIHVEL